MSYAILVRKTQSQQFIGSPSKVTVSWYLETYYTDAPEIGVTTAHLEPWKNHGLIVVLSNLEKNMGVKLVGNDGPDRFVLHNTDRK